MCVCVCELTSFSFSQKQESYERVVSRHVSFFEKEWVRKTLTRCVCVFFDENDDDESDDDEESFQEQPRDEREQSLE